MSRPASVTKSDLDRAMQCMIKAGLRIVEVVVEPRGVRIITEPVAKPQLSEEGDGLLEWPTG